MYVAVCDIEQRRYVMMLRVKLLYTKSMRWMFCSPFFGHSILCSSDKELNRWLAALYFTQVLLLYVTNISQYCLRFCTRFDLGTAIGVLKAGYIAVAVTRFERWVLPHCSDACCH